MIITQQLPRETSMHEPAYPEGVSHTSQHEELIIQVLLGHTTMLVVNEPHLQEKNAELAVR